MTTPLKRSPKRAERKFFEPLTFEGAPRRMSNKAQSIEFARILHARLARLIAKTDPRSKRNGPLRACATQDARPISPPNPLPDAPTEICRYHSVVVILSEGLLAERWFCSVSRLQRWRSEKVGPPYLKMSGKILYRLSDIEAYEQSCLVIPGAEK